MKPICIALLILLFYSALALATPPSTVTATAITKEEVKNARCCIPNIGNGPDDLVHFKNGSFRSAAYPFAELRAMAFGNLDGKPAAVAEMCWNTGGSGNWTTVLLFRKVKDKLEVQGSYEATSDLPSGGTMVSRLEIRNNKIYFYGLDPVHERTITKPLIRSSSCFKPCNYKKH